MARPQHSKGHPQCPHANWAACDRAVALRFGQCKAMVGGKGEPHPCTRIAIGEEGWCGQHLLSELERERKAARQAVIAEKMARDIEEYMAWTAEHPSVWDSRR